MQHKNQSQVGVYCMYNSCALYKPPNPSKFKSAQPSVNLLNSMRHVAFQLHSKVRIRNAAFLKARPDGAPRAAKHRDLVIFSDSRSGVVGGGSSCLSQQSHEMLPLQNTTGELPGFSLVVRPPEKRIDASTRGGKLRR